MVSGRLRGDGEENGRGRRGVAVKQPASARPELERERVAEIQRARMLSAMVDLTREQGAERVTVAHVVARAGVSRRTFYEIFADREACLLEALDDAIERIAAAVLPAYRRERGWARADQRGPHRDARAVRRRARRRGAVRG